MSISIGDRIAKLTGGIHKWIKTYGNASGTDTYDAIRLMVEHHMHELYAECEFKHMMAIYESRAQRSLAAAAKPAETDRGRVRSMIDTFVVATGQANLVAERIDTFDVVRLTSNIAFRIHWRDDGSFAGFHPLTE